MKKPAGAGSGIGSKGTILTRPGPRFNSFLEIIEV